MTPIDRDTAKDMLNEALQLGSAASMIVLDAIDGRIAAAAAEAAPVSVANRPPAPPLPADAPAGSTLEWRFPKEGERWWWNNAEIWTTQETDNPHWVLVYPPPALAADPVPAPGQVWGDAERQVLVLSGGTGVVLAGTDTWARGGWMSVVEAGRFLRENGYRYIGDAQFGVKGKE